MSEPDFKAESRMYANIASQLLEQLGGSAQLKGDIYAPNANLFVLDRQSDDTATITLMADCVRNHPVRPLDGPLMRELGR